MSTPKRRVSYVISPSPVPVPRLALPAANVSRLGRTGPLLVPLETATSPTQALPGTQHRLGVSALALDDSTLLQGRDAPEGILYSGGRDGMVVGWDLAVMMRQRRAEADDEHDDKWRTGSGRRWEMMTGWSDMINDDDGDDERITSDGDVLGDVTAFSKRPKTSQVNRPLWDIDPGSPPQPSRFRQSAQMHMDWINDLALCNSNQTVVTASSDGSVKAWNPHSPTNPPAKIGAHTDFVRCLASCRSQNWIASGSFDRTIKLWDLSAVSDPIITLNPIDATAPKSSVYAIAADPYGKTIASGSPERVVRLWDPRSGKRTSKLVGHTDNIRAILISEDSRYLLTGSADASVKLWSLASQRCLHTFTHHDESVWSLFSSSPTLECFYSGDRAGWVCRVDVEGCTDVAEGECVVLCRDEVAGGYNEATGGVNAIVALDDQMLWTASATNSSIQKWIVPQRRSYRALALQKDLSDISIDPSSPFEAQFTRPPSLKKRTTDDASLHAPSMMIKGDEDEDGTLYGIPYESLIKLVSPFPYTAGGRDPETATLYSAASVMSFKPHPSTMSPPLSQPDSAEAAYHARELASEATPLVKAPSDVIPGAPGLVRTLILNDRIHALTVDTRGEVAVWDLVRGACRGVYGKAALQGLTDGENFAHIHSAREALELVRERIEGEAVVSPWATADTKAGILSIHISERCFEAEVYADEVGFRGRSGFNDESKLNLGKWVVRNLFLGFLKEESRIRRRSHSTAEPDLVPHSSLGHTIVSASNMIPAIRASKSSPAQHLTSLRTPLIPIQALNTHVPPLSLPSSVAGTTPAALANDATPMQHRRLRSTTLDSSKTEDYFTVKRQNSVSASEDRPDVSSPGGGLMGRLKNFGKSKPPRPTSEILQPSSTVESEDTAVTPMPSKPEVVETKPQTPLDALLSQHFAPPGSMDAPTHAFPHGLKVMISEEDGWGGWTVQYIGSPHLSFSQFGDDVDARRRVVELEQALPLWLMEFLFLGKIPPAPAQVKVSFVLLPWREELPELINTTQSKLTANRFLRVRKLILHVHEKLDKLSTPMSPPTRTLSRTSSERGSFETAHGHSHHQHTSSVPISPPPETLYEILCNDVLLPLDMSLAAVRQYVWRQSAELVMHYRKKV